MLTTSSRKSVDGTGSGLKSRKNLKVSSLKSWGTFVYKDITSKVDNRA